MRSEKILVVGGTGLIGGAAALHLAELGHQVTISGRNPPRPGALDRLPFLPGSFLSEDIDRKTLSTFDVLVFAAGNDLRQAPVNGDHDQHFHNANTIGVPAFFARAKQAGVGCGIYVGSYYAEVVSPERVAASGYLRSRKAADDGVRALSDNNFRACCLNAPFVPGMVEGVSARSLDGLMRFLLAMGDDAWIIPGGANFISTTAFAQAVVGALAHGQGGKAYLIGDENWTFEHFCNLLLQGIGRPPLRHVRDDSHPVFIDESLYAGRGATVSYEPGAETMADLRYERGKTSEKVIEMAPYYADRARRNVPL